MVRLMSATVFLVRHATPDWSRTDIRYDIPPGPPLTAQGEAEAAKLGAFLQMVGVRKFYTSPLERTQRTAQIAAGAAQAAVVEADAIAEWRRGESETEVLARFTPFWASVWEESVVDGPIALVTHGGPIRLMLEHLRLDRAAIDFYRKQFDRDNPAPPAGAWQVTRLHTKADWQMELAFTPQPYQLFLQQPVYV
jgi:broad specificity phosphatase PhoE